MGFQTSGRTCPRPELLFPLNPFTSCLETHRSACLSDKHGVQSKGTNEKGRSHPRLWEVALAPQGPGQGHPSHLQRWGLGVSDFCDPHALPPGSPRESSLELGSALPRHVASARKLHRDLGDQSWHFASQRGTQHVSGTPLTSQVSVSSYISLLTEGNCIFCAPKVGLAPAPSGWLLPDPHSSCECLVPNPPGWDPWLGKGLSDFAGGWALGHPKLDTPESK